MAQKFRVRAQRMQYADMVVVVPDGEEVTSQRIQEELTRPGGKYIITNVIENARWLPTQHEPLQSQEPIEVE